MLVRPLTASRTSLIIFLLFGFYFFISDVYAKDLGVRGHTFKIEEPSLVERISRELSEVDWEEINQGIAKKAKKKFSNLENASGLIRASADEMKLHDMSFRVTRDIWAPQPDGNEVLIARKGTIINPFDIRIPRTRFFFFNPKDELQLKIAEKLYRDNLYRFIPVIVEGDIPHLIKKWGAQVYYAYPFVVKQLRVEKYPSLIGVKDKMLAVYEFDANNITLEKVKEVWDSLD